MNIGIIFAGGVGRRMNTNGIPKQFLEINDIPIIIHTLRKFEECNEINAIVISCVDSHIELLEKLVKKYDIKKVKDIVVGGESGQMSIYNALIAARKISDSDKDIVLIHDGVRPIIDSNLLIKNIESVEKNGSSISCIKQKETTVISPDNETIKEFTNRDITYIARAPQCFFIKDIIEAQENAINSGNTNVIDSCTVMMQYGKISNPHIVECNTDNIKITTPDDYYIAEALINFRKNERVLGIGDVSKKLK